MGSVGLALWAFRAQVTSDPHAALDDWNPNENDPCRWSRVHCVGGEVHKLYALHFEQTCYRRSSTLK